MASELHALVGAIRNVRRFSTGCLKIFGDICSVDSPPSSLLPSRLLRSIFSRGGGLNMFAQSSSCPYTYSLRVLPHRRVQVKSLDVTRSQLHCSIFDLSVHPDSYNSNLALLGSNCENLTALILC